MALEADQAFRLSFPDKLCLEVLVADNERNVHEGTVFLADSALKQFALIKIIVEELCLFLIALLHGLQTAHLLDPLEYLAADIDAVGGRGIKEGIVVSLGLPLEHGGCARNDIVTDEVFTNDGDDDTCRSDILLHAAVHDGIFGDVYRLGKEAGGDVCHKVVTLGIGQLVELCTVNGIVLADIYVIRLFGNIKVAAVRNVAVGLVFRGSNGNGIAVLSGFLVGFLGPLSGDDIGCDMIAHKVHGNCRKLGPGAALQEKHLIVVGNIEKIAKICFCFLDDSVEDLSAMAHLHN